jgi:hypothetical protein
VGWWLKPRSDRSTLSLTYALNVGWWVKPRSGRSTLTLTSALYVGWWLKPRSDRSTLPLTSARNVGWRLKPRSGRFASGKDPVLIYRRLGRPHSRSRLVRKISSSPGFDPWTVRPVAILTELRRPTHSIEY